MTSDHPTATVVILTKNSGRRFSSVIAHVFRQSGVDFEVLVIDSGSVDRTLFIAGKYSVRLVTIRPEDFGHGKTRNLAAKLAKGKFIVFLTHDAAPKNEYWLMELLKPFTDSQVAGVYGRQIPHSNEQILDKIFFQSLYGNQPITWAKNSYSSGDNIFSDANSAVRKNLLVKYPYKDNIIVSEDYEWANRVMQLGYKIVYHPGAQVIHSHSYNLLTLFKRNFDIGISYKYISNFNNNSQFIMKGIRLFKNEISSLIKFGYPHIIPLAFVRNCVRYIAISLGKNESLLPNSIKKNYLSAQRWYWL